MKNKQKLKEKTEIFILLICLLILLLGCHMNATYVTSATANTIKGDEVIFLDEAGYSCTLNRETPIKKGATVYIKWDNNGTSWRSDDKAIEYGESHFGWWVWN